MRIRMAPALLTLCLAVSACETTKRTAEALRPDKTNPDRFVCERLGTRPQLPAEYQIDWNRVRTARTVEQAIGLAQDEHKRFVAVLRTRENVVAGYVLQLEGVNFLCFNNMAWQRDFYQGLDRQPPR